MRATRLLMVATAFAVVLCVWFHALPAAAKNENPDDEWSGGEEETHTSLNIGYAKIDDVKFTAPGPGAPCVVTATITLKDTEYAENVVVKSAKLTYVVNGDRKRATIIDMTRTGDTYTGEIPGQRSGTKVSFYITVTDSEGNTSTEALPVESKKKAAAQLVAGVPDRDNFIDIVPDSMDILGTSIGYDKNYIYAGFDVQGNISGGTIDPPYIQLYGIKFSNPDTEEYEGLMVGNLWVYVPLIKDNASATYKIIQFIDKLTGKPGSALNKTQTKELEHFKRTGMLILDIAKIISGKIIDGIILTAEQRQLNTGDPRKFVGRIKRSVLGANPSGFIRMIVITAANASTNDFMPIPLDMSRFIQIYTRYHEYKVKKAK